MADETVKNDKCLRLFCNERKWKEYCESGSCMCKEHTEEVLRGERSAPPLRHNIDYVGQTRFIVDYRSLPEQETYEQETSEFRQKDLKDKFAFLVEKYGIKK